MNRCYRIKAKTSNYYFSDIERVKSRFEIKAKSSMPGGRGHRSERKPLVTIYYSGLEKQLVFDFDDTDKVDSATHVDLTIRKGLLGFDILETYKVVDDESW